MTPGIIEPPPAVEPPAPVPALALDGAAEVQRIERFLLSAVSRTLRRRGLVLGVSGGVDSAVCATLATRALGAGRVFALLMPEQDSSAEATARAERLCRRLGIAYAVEDITPALEAAGCYRRQSEAIAQVIGEYGPGWRHKIVLAGGAMERDRIPYFDLVAESPDGQRLRRRLPAAAYLQLVAATNFKQRIRKNLEYYHAERLNHAVLGTPNLLEYALGFFVRGGDGLADVKPIAHLFKTQVYALAAHLDVPGEIRSQPPSTDTYSLPQTQEEFYFSLPYDQADLVLHGLIHGTPVPAIALATGLSVAQVERALRDFAAKREVARRSLNDALTLTPALPPALTPAS